MLGILVANNIIVSVAKNVEYNVDINFVAIFILHVDGIFNALGIFKSARLIFNSQFQSWGWT